MNTITIDDPRWQAWCDKFLATAKTRLSQEQSELYIKLFLMTREKNAQLKEIYDEILPKSFALQVFNAHAQRIGLEVDPAVVMFICMAMTQSPGEAVMYVHALRRLQQKTGASLTMDYLHGNADSVFAEGYPSREVLHVIWDEQKIPREERTEGDFGDNMLDRVVQR